MSTLGRSRRVALLVLLALAGACGDDGLPGPRAHLTPVAPSRTVAAAAAPSFVVSAAAVLVAAGERAEVRVTFPGRGDSASRGAPPVVLGVDSLPVGARATFAPDTLADSVATSVLSFAVGRETPTGAHELTVRARARGDTAVRTAPLTLFVLPARRFTVHVAAPVVALARGETTTVAVRVARADSSRDTLALSVDGTPPGLRARIARDSAARDSATLTLVADPGAMLGAFDVTVRARGDAEEESATVRVVVHGGAVSDSGTAWTACDSTALVRWVAVRDGSGPWRRVKPTDGRYVVRTRSADAGIAVVTGSAAAGYTLAVEYGTAGVASPGCGGTPVIDTLRPPTRPPTRRVVGTLAGLAAGTRGVVEMGGESATLAYAAGPQPFALDSVLRDTRFLSAMRLPAAERTVRIPDRLLLRRDVVADTLAPIDLASDEAFAPLRPTLRLFGAGRNALASVQLLTMTESFGFGFVGLYTDTLGARRSALQYVALPAARRAAGDVYMLSVVDGVGGAGGGPGGPELPEPDVRAGDAASPISRGVRDATRRLGVPHGLAALAGPRLARAVDDDDPFAVPIVRMVMQTFSTPNDLAVDLGPLGERPVVDVAAAAPYPRFRARYRTAGVPYSSASVQLMAQGGGGFPGLQIPGLGGGHTVVITRNRATAASGDIELELPDFSGVDGWDDAWAPASAAFVSWSFVASDVRVSGAGASLPGIYAGQRARFLVTGGLLMR